MNKLAAARKKARAKRRNAERAAEHYHIRARRAAREAERRLFAILAEFEPGQYDDGYRREAAYAKTISCEVDGIVFAYSCVMYEVGTTYLMGYEYTDPKHDVVVEVNSPKWVEWKNSLPELTIEEVFAEDTW